MTTTKIRQEGDGGRRPGHSAESKVAATYPGPRHRVWETTLGSGHGPVIFMILVSRSQEQMGEKT